MPTQVNNCEIVSVSNSKNVVNGGMNSNSPVIITVMAIMSETILFYYSIFTTLRYKNNMVSLIIAITVIITGLLLFIPPLTTFFEFETLTISQLFTCVGIGFVSVIWYELVKIRTRLKNNTDRRDSS